MGGEKLRQFQKPCRARSVVVSAVKDALIALLVGVGAHVVVVGADDDNFVFALWVAPFHQAEDIGIFQSLPHQVHPQPHAGVRDGKGVRLAGFIYALLHFRQGQQCFGKSALDRHRKDARIGCQGFVPKRHGFIVKGALRTGDEDDRLRSLLAGDAEFVGEHRFGQESVVVSGHSSERQDDFALHRDALVIVVALFRSAEPVADKHKVAFHFSVSRQG